MPLEDTATTVAPAAATETPASSTPSSDKPAETKVIVVEPSPQEAREQAEASTKKAAFAAYDRAVARSNAEKAERNGEVDPTVKAAADRAESKTPVRGADGKFVSSDPAKTAPEAEAKPGHNQPPEATEAEGKQAVPEKKDQPKTEAKEPASPAIQPPTSWSKEMKARWDKLEPEVQQYLHNQDKDVAKAFTRYGQIKAAAEPLVKTADKYRDTFRGWKLSPDQAIDIVMQREIALDRDPLGTILHLAKEKGVDLAQYAATQLDPDLLPPHPETAKMQAEIARLNRLNQQLVNQREADLEEIKAYFEQQREVQKSERLNAAEQDFEAFAKDKNDFGKYETQIAALIGPLMAANPKMTGKQALTEAYETVRARDPDYIKSITEAERKKAEAAKAADAARLASSLNVQGTPNARSGDQPLRAKLDSIFAKHKAAGTLPSNISA